MEGVDELLEVVEDGIMPDKEQPESATLKSPQNRLWNSLWDRKSGTFSINSPDYTLTIYSNIIDYITQIFNLMSNYLKLKIK